MSGRQSSYSRSLPVEPATSPDPQSAEEIGKIITGLNRGDGTTVIISTYDMIQGQWLAHGIGAVPQAGMTRESSTSRQQRISPGLSVSITWCRGLWPRAGTARRLLTVAAIPFKATTIHVIPER